MSKARKLEGISSPVERKKPLNIDAEKLRELGVPEDVAKAIIGAEPATARRLRKALDGLRTESEPATKAAKREEARRRASDARRRATDVAETVVEVETVETVEEPEATKSAATDKPKTYDGGGYKPAASEAETSQVNKSKAVKANTAADREADDDAMTVDEVVAEVERLFDDLKGVMVCVVQAVDALEERIHRLEER